MQSKLVLMGAKVAVLASILFSGTALSQEKKLSPREQIQKRYESTLDMRFDQSYANNENPREQLDLYLPKKPNGDKPLPIVVYIHGGGWVGGDRAGYAGAAAKQASTGNYAAASIGYRAASEAKWPAQIYDCKAAIRWIRGHAKELNINPDLIAVQGGSAGGHLVVLLGLTGNLKELEGDIGEYTKLKSNVACVVNFCGPTDLTTPLMQGDAALKDDPVVVQLIGGSIGDKLDVAKAASPMTYVTKDAVPILTAHGTKDMRVNFTNAANLDAALKKVGASSLLIPVTDGSHGIGGGSELDRRVQQFLDLHCRGIKADISTEPIPTQANAPLPKK